MIYINIFKSRYILRLNALYPSFSLYDNIGNEQISKLFTENPKLGRFLN